MKKEKESKGWWSSWFGSDSEDEEVDIDFHEESTGIHFHITYDQTCPVCFLKATSTSFI